MMDDIWSSGILTFDSPLKELLDTNSYTLEDLLDEDELLQEVKGCHPQLKSFFNEEKNVAGLVQCLLRVPKEVHSSSLSSCSSGGKVSDAGLIPESEVGSDNKEMKNNVSSTDYVDNVDNSDNNTTEVENNSSHNTHTTDGVEENEDDEMQSLHKNHSDTPFDEGNEQEMEEEGRQEHEGKILVHGENVSVLNDVNKNNNITKDTIMSEGANENEDDINPSKDGLQEEQNETSDEPEAEDDNDDNIKNSTSITNETSLTSEDMMRGIEEEEEEAKEEEEEDEIDLYDDDDSDLPEPGAWLLDNITEKVEKKKSKTSDIDLTTSLSKESTSPKDACISPKALSKEDYERIYLRYPYIACEVICCENEDILDIIVYGSAEVDNDVDEDDQFHFSNMNSSKNHHHNDCNKRRKKPRKKQSILDMLFSIFYTTPPSQLDDRRAGYLEKILSVLFRTRPKVMESYLNGDHLLLLDHVNSESKSSKGDSYDHIDEADILHRGGGVALLDALFNHLHSNSITQIVQRLLMPKQPSNKASDGDDYSNGSNSEKQNGWGDHGSNDNDGDDHDDDNLITSGADEFGKVHCNWSDGEHAINLLLERLLGQTNDVDDILEENYGPNDNLLKNVEDDEAMKRFDCAQNASEILIAIIQHSTLSSNVMRMLTNKTVLSNLIECACFTDAQRLEMRNTKSGSVESVPACFSRHRSTMTTAMSVLESLVLQLGGYGTVPTTPGYDVSNQEAIGKDCVNAKDEENINMNTNDQKPFNTNQLQRSFPEANSSDLIAQLPLLLQRLSILLKHPDTKTWISPVQYLSEPQQLLGASRLQIVRLIESLVLLGQKEVDKILCQSDCLETCLKLFWDFPWCSMLHQSVANLLVHALEGGVERYDLQHYFLYRCNLVQRLMGSFVDMDNNNSSRKGDKSEVDADYECLLKLKNDQVNSDSPSSSLDGEIGSASSSEDGHDFTTPSNDVESIPVSDDDVDAAMEQEEFDQLNKYETSNDGSHHLNHDQELNEESSSNTSIDMITEKQTTISNTRNDHTFRIGYMGHVIIVCQAIVHACNVNEKDSNEKEAYDNIEVIKERNHHDIPDETSNLDLSATIGDDAKNDCDNAAIKEMARPITPDGVMTLLRRHSIYSEWIEFVESTLASETAVQSTPLGGCNNQNNSNTLIQQAESITLENGEHIDHDINGHDVVEKYKGTYTGEGDIDLDNTKFDDTEVDIAAKMMENITLPTPRINGTDEGTQSNGNGSHHRRRGVLGGDGSGNGFGHEFGTVVQMHHKSEDYYQYDDPLGGWHDQFPDDLCFEGKDFGDNEDDIDDDNENDVPVLDLFTGSINFDAEAKDNETGWANFDEGFADYNDNEDSKIIDSSPDPFDTTSSNFINDDFFNEEKPAQFDAPFADDRTPTHHVNKTPHITDITEA